MEREVFAGIGQEPRIKYREFMGEAVSNGFKRGWSGNGELITFWNSAFESGALARVKESEWGRKNFRLACKITVLHLETDANFSEIGPYLDPTLERPDSIYRRFITRVHGQSSAEIQQKFPLQRLLAFRKPNSQRVREKMSASCGGKQGEIRRLLEAKLENLEEIAALVGMTPRSAGEVVTELRKRGIGFDSRYSRTKKLDEAIPKAKSVDQIRSVLREVTRFYVRSRPGLFKSLSSVARSNGFQVRNDQLRYFAGVLASRDVPFITFKYDRSDGTTVVSSFVLSRHADFVAIIFKSDPSLRRFRRG